jgi:5-methylcytosine-specific restriction endonuclease McrA
MKHKPEDLPKGRCCNAQQIREHFGRKKGECTWCGEPVGKGRTRWCGDDCVNEFASIYNPGYIRAKVWKRDNGICGGCGRDLKYWVEFALKAKRFAAPDGRDDIVYQPGCSLWDPVVNRRGRKNRKRASRYWKAMFGGGFRMMGRHAGAGRIERLASWEADHIIPVVRGGVGLGLDNIRILCTQCHKKETKRLAAERAKERKKNA